MGYCSKCINIDLQKLADRYGDGRQTLHPNYSALEDSVAHGCPLCTMFHVAWIKAQMEASGLDEVQTIRHHYFRDLYAPGRFYVGCVVGHLKDDFHGVGFERISFERGLSHRSLQYGNVQFRNFSLAALFRLISRSGTHEFAIGRQIERIPSFDLALSWIRECAQTHQNCGQMREEILPRRLLDVGESKSRKPRPFETKSKRGIYLTLSHCWGQSQPLVTTSANYEQHLHSIPFETLPRTFQDAVTVIRNPGFRFLWIDCLCILQDDEEDWAIQCAEMDAIFERSAFCIATPAAVSPDSGFLHNRAEADTTYCVFPSNSISNDEPCNVIIRPDVISGHSNFPKEKDSPLAKRGWVLQECLLPPRVLYFGSAQLYFECRTTEFYEHCWYRSHESIHVSSIVEKKDLNLEQSYKVACDLWRNIVTNYSSCLLSKSTDKLPALSGLARRFCERFDDEYLAGVFRGDLSAQLLWCVNDARKESVDGKAQAQVSIDVGQYIRSSDSRDYIAPSWSWASQKGPVSFDFSHWFRNLPNKVEFEQASVVLKTLNPFGEVMAGTIIARAPVAPIKLKVIQRRWPAPSFRYVALHGTLFGQNAYYCPDMLLSYREGEQFEILCMLLKYCKDDASESWVGLGIEIAGDGLGTYRRKGMIGSNASFGADNAYDDQSIWANALTQTITLV